MWDEVVREGVRLLLDNLPPLVLALCLVAGVALGVVLYHRSRSKQEVAIYAEALKDVADALKTSNQTVESTQKRLTEVHNTNISLNEQLTATQGQLKAERETFAQRLRVQQEAFEEKLQAEREDFTRTLSEAEGRIRTLVADVGSLEQERAGSEATVQALTGKVASLEAQVATLQTKLQASEEARSQATAELEQLRGEVGELRARVARAEAEGDDAKVAEQVLAEPVEGTPAVSSEGEGSPEVAGEHESSMQGEQEL